jgi:hypothetical protein
MGTFVSAFVGTFEGLSLAACETFVGAVGGAVVGCVGEVVGTVVGDCVGAMVGAVVCHSMFTVVGMVVDASRLVTVDGF